MPHRDPRPPATRWPRWLPRHPAPDAPSTRVYYAFDWSGALLARYVWDDALGWLYCPVASGADGRMPLH